MDQGLPIKKISLILVIVICSRLLFSQEKSFPDVILSIAEELASGDTDPDAPAVFLEQLSSLAEYPVSINS